MCSVYRVLILLLNVCDGVKWMHKLISYIISLFPMQSAQRSTTRLLGRGGSIGFSNRGGAKDYVDAAQHPEARSAKSLIITAEV